MGGFYGRERVTGERAVKQLEPLKVFLAAGATIFVLAASAVAAWSGKVDASAFDAHTAAESARISVLERAESGHDVRLKNLEQGAQWSQGLLYQMAKRDGIPDLERPPKPEAVPTPHPTPQPGP